MTRRKLIAVLLCAFLMVCVAGCSNENQNDVEQNTGQDQNQNETEQSNGAEKSVSIGITRSPASFNPTDRPDWPTFHIASVMFPPLAALNENMEFDLLLAERIETEDNQTFVVKLNANVKWTDGKPVTADDVMFSLEMITHPEYSSLLASQMVPLEGLDPGGKRTMDMADFPGARKVDEHTIEFKTKNPLALDVFHEKIAGNLKALPKHVLKDADPSKLNQHPFMQEPTVSYGSFMFVRYQKDQFVELKANPDFFLGAPKLDKLYFKIVSPANLVAQLESGDIDMNYPDIGPIPVEDYQRVQNLPHIEATQGQPVNYKFMGFNTERLSDKRIRQAIAYGINRELLVNNLLQGFGEVGNGPYSPAHPYYKEALNGTYPYDPERAKQLLAEANWKANQPLVLIVPANQGLERIGDIIVNNLQEIGVTVKAELMDTPAAIQRLLKGDFDLWLLTNTFLLDPDQYNFYATGMPNNFSRISHSDIDELLKKGLEVADEAERKEIYGRYQEVFNEEMPALQLFADYRLRAVNKRVIVGGPKDIGMLNHVHEWDVEQ